MSEHTPGPWFVKGRGQRFWVWSEMGRICTMTPWNREVETADGRLIAAAPELLAALTKARNAIDSHTDECGSCRRLLPEIDAAIAKATGQP